MRYKHDRATLAKRERWDRQREAKARDEAVREEVRALEEEVRKMLAVQARELMRRVVKVETDAMGLAEEIAVGSVELGRVGWAGGGEGEDDEPQAAIDQDSSQTDDDGSKPGTGGIPNAHDVLQQHKHLDQHARHDTQQHQLHQPKSSSLNIHRTLGSLVQHQRQTTVDLAHALVHHSRLSRTATTLARDIAAFERKRAATAAAVEAAAQEHRTTRLQLYAETKVCRCRKRHVEGLACSAEVPGETTSELKEVAAEVNVVERERRNTAGKVLEVGNDVRQVERGIEELRKTIARGGYDLIEIGAKIGTADWRARQVEPSLETLRSSVARAEDECRQAIAERETSQIAIEEAREATAAERVRVVELAKAAEAVERQVSSVEEHCARLRNGKEAAQPQAAAILSRIARAKQDLAARTRRVETAIGPVRAKRAKLDAERLILRKGYLPRTHTLQLRTQLDLVRVQFESLSGQAANFRERGFGVGKARRRAGEKLVEEQKALMGQMGETELEAGKAKMGEVKEECAGLAIQMAEKRSEVEERAVREKAQGERTPLSTAPTSSGMARGAFELERASKAVEVLSAGVQQMNQRVDKLRAQNSEMMMALAGRC